jgi:hypothetical protein
MSKWDETDPYTDYELGSSRPHGPLPKPEPEPNWRSMYIEKGIEAEYWQKRSRYAEIALTYMAKCGNSDAERVLDEIAVEFIGG